MERKIRVLLAKPVLDGHDRGVKVVARALRDAGMEVIYTGLHKSPEQIVEAALQEDADVIGLSTLSGSHMALFPRIVDLLKENEMFEETLVIAGGIIPDQDIESLQAVGINGIFGPGTDTDKIVNYIKQNFRILKDMSEQIQLKISQLTTAFLNTAKDKEVLNSYGSYQNKFVQNFKDIFIVKCDSSSFGEVDSLLNSTEFIVEKNDSITLCYNMHSDLSVIANSYYLQYRFSGLFLGGCQSVYQEK